ncbi:transporter substrate-binding domain-containing protein [Taklimakanibacter deserti]|uniref:transporter substrate-binding domain-containing protein n=1 Tax=Taklimakanibacter deserti TaxID=2267839 RepID=UPI0034D498EF
MAIAAIRLLLSCVVLTLAVGMASAQDTSTPSRQPLRVGVYISPPFVMKEGDRFTGMAIEPWEALAAKLKLPFDYEEVATVTDLIEATSSGKLDVAVTNLSITEARIERIDFTHPWYDAGLRLMVNDNHATSFSDVFAGLRDAGFLRTYAMLAGIIVVATFLLTTFDRRFNSEFPNRWRDGLADNFYHVMSVATSGKAPAPRQHAHRRRRDFRARQVWFRVAAPKWPDKAADRGHRRGTRESCSRKLAVEAL